MGDGSAAIVRKEPVAAGPVDNKHLMVDVVVGMGVGVIVDALYLSQQGEAVGGGKDVREGEIVIRYKTDLGRLTIGADNYFFQEGSAKKFENAKYGLLKVDSEGNSILVGLCDGDRRLIK